jgi:hypothetical protein
MFNLLSDDIRLAIFVDMSFKKIAHAGGNCFLKIYLVGNDVQI